MALKKKLSKEAWATLKKEFQDEYKLVGDEYVLDVDGEEDTGALLRSKDHEKQLRKDAEKRLKELQDKLDEESENKSRKEGDIEKLEAKWKKDLEASQNEANSRIERLSNFARRNLIDRTANEIASKISTVPTLMAKALRERLAVDFEGDEPTLKILDAQGKPSALTTEQLSQEFAANKEFASIIIASKASGGGAPRTSNFAQGGGAPSNSNNQPADLSKMDPKALKSVIAERIAAKSSE